MRRLVLLDRDGVINADSPDFIKAVEEWLPIAGSLPAIARIKRAGLSVGVCTNQSGVGRGLLTTATLGLIHAKLEDELARYGVAMDVIRFCPHLPDDGCGCRKPRPGMLLDAMRELGFHPKDTVYVGDSQRDIDAARAAGCEPILVRTGNGHHTEANAGNGGVRTFDDLAAFAEDLLGATGDEPGAQHC